MNFSRFPFFQSVDVGYGVAGGGRFANAKRQRGVSLLELVVIVIVIALLLMVAIDRLWPVQKAAEATEMEQVLGSLRSALGIKLASYLIDDNVAGIRSLAGSNPMDLLSQRPKNYDGAVDVADPAQMPAGTWYFDRRSGLLIYQVRNADFFSGGLGTPPRAGFEIRLTYDEVVRPDAMARKSHEITGAELVAVAPYHWGRR